MILVIRIAAILVMIGGVRKVITSIFFMFIYIYFFMLSDLKSTGFKEDVFVATENNES